MGCCFTKNKVKPLKNINFDNILPDNNSIIANDKKRRKRKNKLTRNIKQYNRHPNKRIMVQSII